MKAADWKENPSDQKILPYSFLYGGVFLYKAVGDKILKKYSCRYSKDRLKINMH